MEVVEGRIVRRGVLWFALSVLTISTLAGTFAFGANAASFSSQPASPRTSGESLSWLFQSSQSASGPYGWIAYKFDEEPWIRCSGKKSLTLTDVPEGQHQLSIADDINISNWSGRGLGSSSFVQPCYMSPSPDPFYPVTSSTVVVDKSPPVVPVPDISVDGLTAVFSVTPTDEYTTVRYIDWTFGDGGFDSTNNQHVLHTYPQSGTYSGKVKATDELGHSAETSFSVTVKGPDPDPVEPDPPVEGGDEAPWVYLTSIKVKKAKKQAVIRFKAGGEGVSTTCGLVGRRLKKCKSPVTLRFPKRGKKYRAVVRATNANGQSSRARVTVRM